MRKLLHNQKYNPEYISGQMFFRMNTKDTTTIMKCVSTEMADCAILTHRPKGKIKIYISCDFLIRDLHISKEYLCEKPLESEYWINSQFESRFPSCFESVGYVLYNEYSIEETLPRFLCWDEFWPNWFPIDQDQGQGQQPTSEEFKKYVKEYFETLYLISMF